MGCRVVCVNEVSARILDGNSIRGIAEDGLQLVAAQLRFWHDTIADGQSARSLSSLNLPPSSLRDQYNPVSAELQLRRIQHPGCNGTRTDIYARIASGE